MERSDSFAMGISGVGSRGLSSHLCSSCDHCRLRKIKCDGKTPCTTCAARYMKANNVTSIEGIEDMSVFHCTYSPAKRRGPVPGRSSRSLTSLNSFGNRKSMGVKSGGYSQGNGLNFQASQWATTLAPAPPSFSPVPNGTSNAAWMPTIPNPTDGPGRSMAQPYFPTNGAATSSSVPFQTTEMLQQRLATLQQEIEQQHFQIEQRRQNEQKRQEPTNTLTSFPHQSLESFEMLNPLPLDFASTIETSVDFGMDTLDFEAAHSLLMEPSSPLRLPSSIPPPGSSLPRGVIKYAPYLDNRNDTGQRLHAYYTLSMDELFRLPCTPTNDEYCEATGQRALQSLELTLLAATRFVEVALGAMIRNDQGLAMELCHASVQCLSEAAEANFDARLTLYVAKAYFLLGIFQIYRGDVSRYVKYVRVCLVCLSKLSWDDRSQYLRAAVSFVDCWVRMIYGNVDDVFATAKETLNGESKLVSLVYSNDQAPTYARALDAVACCIRSACDGPVSDGGTVGSASCCVNSSTCRTKCDAHSCLSAARSLLRRYGNEHSGAERCCGLHLIVSAMETLTAHTELGTFTDDDIQSILAVGNTVVDNPLLLHHAGPTYHMVSNVTMLMCHWLNGMYASKREDPATSGENDMWDEVLETFMAVRKVLTLHRRTLPARLRCHEIPRPGLASGAARMPFIDTGTVALCPCTACRTLARMNPIVGATTEV